MKNEMKELITYLVLEGKIGLIQANRYLERITPDFTN